MSEIARSECRQERLGPSQRRIVVVDDEKRIADTLALILISKGYAAESAYDAATALDICRRSPADLVLSDVVMPGMNGIEMAIELRRTIPGTQVLLFSGQAATADMLEEARARGHEFELLAKPVHPEKLLEKIKSMIGCSAAVQAGS